ncbi:MAG: hypothetical protein JXB32_13895 [Deltaproteobacteria bacterium]|nr:hypothetical protein [Deltaproteobacteria bacterium]
MATKCHVCGKPVKKPLEIPVCGDPNVKITVCSAHCRDEYIAGYVETREGRAVRMLRRPRGAGFVLAALWGVYGLVHLAGGPLSRIVAVPLLPAQPGPEFYSGGAAALLVAYAVLREVRLARYFSAGLAVVGLVFAALAFARSRQFASVVEAATVFPAALLLSLGDPGPRRALGALVLFAIWPAALIVTTITGLEERSERVERVASESYPEPTYDDTRNRLRFSVPDGWFILRENSTLLAHDGALFRAVRPDGHLVATVHDRPECDPADAAQVERVLLGLGADGHRVGLVGDPRPLPVDSALGEGRSFFVGRNAPEPALWYVVFVPWTDGRCLELRCGGHASHDRRIRTDCVQLGARGLAGLP